MVVALFLLTSGMLSAIQVYHVGVGKTKATAETATALAAVVNELETLRAQPFESLHEADAAPFISEAPELGNLPDAHASVTIRAYGDPRLALKEVTARVRWCGEHGRLIEKRMTTLMGRQGEEAPK